MREDLLQEFICWNFISLSSEIQLACQLLIILWNVGCVDTVSQNYSSGIWSSALAVHILLWKYLGLCLPSAMVVNAFLCTGVSFNELLSVHLPLENPLVALLDLSHFIELLYKTNCSAWVLSSLKRDRTPSRSEICLRLLSKSDLLFPCELLELV